MHCRIRLDGWETGIKFVAGHFLPGVEKCRRLHGHNYAMSVEIEGEVGERGILLDFLTLKELCRTLVGELDHRLLLPARPWNMEVRRSMGEIMVSFEGKKYTIPEEDVAFIPVSNITAEELSCFLLSRLMESGIMSGDIRHMAVCVSEGRGQEAWCTEDRK